MKGSFRLLACIVAAIAWLGCGSGDGGRGNEVTEKGTCVLNDDSPPERPAPSEATLPFIRVEGTDIVAEGGGRVALRGVNFGSWLQVESWINGIGAIQEDDIFPLFLQKAEELGALRPINKAVREHIADMYSDSIGKRRVIAEIRAESYEEATPEEKPALDELWAWFDAIPWIFEEESLWSYFAGRFGPDRAEKLRAALVGHWITEEDVRAAAGLGLNLIRVPFWYQALDDEALPRAKYRPEGWGKLYEVLEWARKYKVYILLDMHGAPGGQSAASHAGLADGNRLWTTGACVEKTASLWKAIALRFADDPHVAGYDLLNEPMGAPDRERYRAIHDAVYRAIREVDARHMIMIEDGYLGGETVSSPAEMGWTNAAFSIHIYSSAETAEEFERNFFSDLRKAAGDWTRFNCPLFVGEFSSVSKEQWAIEGMGRVFAGMNAAGIHWAPWTWKYCNQDSIWGLYAPAAPIKMDIKNMTFEQILDAFEKFDTANFEVNRDYETRFRENVSAEAAPLDLGKLP